jgi:hypothetical protein
MNYTIERTPKQFINELIIDTENAIRQLDEKIQYSYRTKATKKLKEILESNTNNNTHRRHKHILHKHKHKSFTSS